MSGVRNIRKIIRRVKLDVLIDDVAQPILMLHILHPSLLIPLFPSLHLLLPCISHLPFQSPISHPLGLSNKFRKMSPPKSHQTPYSIKSCVTSECTALLGRRLGYGEVS